MTMAVADKVPVQRIKSLRGRTGGNSFGSDISIDCNFAQVEYFLRHVIMEFCQDVELYNTIHAQTRGLAHRVKASGVPNCHGDLLNVVAILEEFLSLCKELKAQHTFEVLTFIGQIKLAQEDTTGATLAFTKALWIASCSAEVPPEHRAAALHRMGVAYAQGRHYQQARDVLRKALETYKAAGYTHNQTQTNEAKTLHETMSRKVRESEESWSSLRSSTGQRLAQILE